jgi:hypothetical protein
METLLATCNTAQYFGERRQLASTLVAGWAWLECR